MAEIIRSGIQSVDDGQRDAGRAIGMKSGQLMKSSHFATGDAGRYSTNRK